MRALTLLLGILWASPGLADGLLIIGSPQIPVASVSIEQLADIYSLKKDFWSEDLQVVPVNREASSAERKRFTERVFNLSPQQLGEYWNRLSFQGKLPPPVQVSDQAVLGFVRSIPGAIGYINGNQAPAGVKVLLRLP
jgi:ABC-type phosphate transport system substrate-binding protein